MKVCSNSNFTLSAMFFSSGSLFPCSVEPPRLSSQFADQVIFVSSPVMSDFGRATGVCFCSGAVVRFS
jgi:hypothetical protein